MYSPISTLVPGRARSAIAVLALTIAFGAVNLAAQSQDSTRAGGPAETGRKSTGDSATVWLAKYRQYPWNGFSVWAGGAVEVRTAANNEHFAGSMRMIGVQVSRDVWRGNRARIAYLGEVLPVMLARSRPPVNRQPDPRISYDPVLLARFQYREAYGFGLAPFGAEATWQTSARTSALFNVTAGGLIFSKVVPYGHATKANFTVSPGIAFQFEPRNRERIAVGYTFHHLSNASFGEANPGMNSQMLYVRISRMRAGADSR